MITFNENKEAPLLIMDVNFPSGTYLQKASDINHLVKSLGIINCHPDTSLGWWCCYPKTMSSLISYVSDPMKGDAEKWKLFRSEMSTQLKSCHHCTINYHKHLLEWEQSSINENLSFSALQAQVKSVTDYNAERVFSSLRSSLRHPSSTASAIESRNALLEVLLEPRVCVKDKVSKVLQAVFLRKCPLDINEHVKPILNHLKYLPPGLVALSFHPRNAVQEWALRVMKQFSSSFQFQSGSCNIVLNQVITAVKGSMKLEDEGCIDLYDPSPYDGLKVNDFVKSYAKVLNYLPDEAIVDTVSLCPGSVAKILAVALSMNDTEVINYASDTLSSLMYKVPFDKLFHAQYLTLNTFVDQIINSLRIAEPTAPEHKYYKSLLNHVLLQGREKLGKAKVIRMHEHIFTNIEAECKKPTISRVLGGAKRRQELLTTGSSVLNWLFEYSAPEPPLNTLRIANFIIEVIKADPENLEGWNLLRTALTLDLFNIIQSIIKHDAKIIAESFLFRPPLIGLAEEEKDILNKICNTFDGSRRVITFNSKLWDDVRKANYFEGAVSSTAKANEVRVFLDLNRLLGCIDTGKFVDHLSTDYFHSVQLSTQGCTTKTVDYVSGCVLVMQSAISRRVKLAFKNGVQDEWRDELPFHVCHMMFSFDDQLDPLCLESILKMYDVNSITIAGTRTKTALNALKRNHLHSSIFAFGFTSATKTLFAWGCTNAVPLKCYLRFFRWYITLCDLRFQELLVSVDSSQWILGVIRNCLSSWKKVPEEQKTPEYQELYCRTLRALTNNWDQLYGASSAADCVVPDDSNTSINDSILQIQASLLEMHEILNPFIKLTWVSCICKVSVSWKSSRTYRNKLASVLTSLATTRDLDIRRCEEIGASINLDDGKILGPWREDIKRKRVVVEKQVDKKKKASSTRISDFFAPKLEGSSSKNTKISNLSALAAKPKPIQRPQLSSAFIRSKNAIAANKKTKTPVEDDEAPLSKIAEMRRDRRQGAQETRSKVIPKRVIAPSAWATREYEVVDLDGPIEAPKKTKFEIEREKAILERKKERERSDKEIKRTTQQENDKKRREQNERDVALGKRRKTPNGLTLPVNPDSPINILSPASKQNSPTRSLSPPPPPPEDFSLPPNRRIVNCGTVSSVFTRLILGNTSFNSSNRINGYAASRCESFRNVGTYVRFWEPLLTEEFNASMETSKKEEEAYFQKFGEPCRLVFDVESQGTNVGNDFFMDFGMDLKRMKAYKKNEAAEQFHPLKARNNDIMFLQVLMPPQFPGAEMKPTPITALALVSDVGVERGRFIMKLKTGFNSASDTPAQGRHVRISRIGSLVTYQRQIEALFDMCNLQDGLLWPILEPKLGWKKNEGALKRQSESNGAELTVPRQFIDDMLMQKKLNESQANAIRAVVISCSPLFKRRGLSKGQYSDHGGITLIQGPPGTGKTSTIVSMLSTILMANPTNCMERSVSFDVDGCRSVMPVPPVRVLVCAPSNAAVDEIMMRVVGQGLLTPGGSRACPRLARVGVGSTNEEIKKMELRKLAGIEEKLSPFDEALALSEAKKQDNLVKCKNINDKISKADRAYKEMRKQLEVLRGLNQDGTKTKEIKGIEEKYNSAQRELSSLHDTKKSLNIFLSEDREELKELVEKKRKDNDIRIAKVLNNAVIVFATLNSSGHEIIQRLGVPFDVTIVDEAAQCVEPDIVIPAIVGRRGKNAIVGFSHLILVGDPKQLPATVLSNNRAVSSRLGCSMFERFAQSSPDSIHMLNTQYRMHPRISSFPSKQFYEGLLKNGESVMEEEKLKKPYYEDSRKRFGPLTFIDTQTAMFREQHGSRGSTSNTEEARLISNGIISLVRLYRQIDFKNEVAVLTPYRDQVSVLKRILSRTSELKDLEVEINTVDGIQGREKSFVFLSTVRGANAKSIGFLSDLRRMNVAITRAKHAVIVVGNADVLSHNDDTWKALIEHCKDENVLVKASKDDYSLFPESRQSLKPPPHTTPSNENVDSGKEQHHKKKQSRSKGKKSGRNNSSNKENNNSSNIEVSGRKNKTDTTKTGSTKQLRPAPPSRKEKPPKPEDSVKNNSTMASNISKQVGRRQDEKGATEKELVKAKATGGFLLRSKPLPNIPKSVPASTIPKPIAERPNTGETAEDVKNSKPPKILTALRSVPVASLPNVTTSCKKTDSENGNGKCNSGTQSTTQSSSLTKVPSTGLTEPNASNVTRATDLHIIQTNPAFTSRTSAMSKPHSPPIPLPPKATPPVTISPRKVNPVEPTTGKGPNFVSPFQPTRSRYGLIDSSKPCIAPARTISPQLVLPAITPTPEKLTEGKVDKGKPIEAINRLQSTQSQQSQTRACSTKATKTPPTPLSLPAALSVPEATTAKYSDKLAESFAKPFFPTRSRYAVTGLSCTLPTNNTQPTTSSSSALSTPATSLKPLEQTKRNMPSPFQPTKHRHGLTAGLSEDKKHHAQSYDGTTIVGKKRSSVEAGVRPKDDGQRKKLDINQKKVLCPTSGEINRSLEVPSNGQTTQSTNARFVSPFQPTCRRADLEKNIPKETPSLNESIRDARSRIPPNLPNEETDHTNSASLGTKFVGADYNIREEKSVMVNQEKQQRDITKSHVTVLSSKPNQSDARSEKTPPLEKDRKSKGDKSPMNVRQNSVESNGHHNGGNKSHNKQVQTQSFDEDGRFEKPSFHDDDVRDGDYFDNVVRGIPQQDRLQGINRNEAARRPRNDDNRGNAYKNQRGDHKESEKTRFEGGGSHGNGDGYRWSRSEYDYRSGRRHPSAQTRPNHYREDDRNHQARNYGGRQRDDSYEREVREGRRLPRHRFKNDNKHWRDRDQQRRGRSNNPPPQHDGIRQQPQRNESSSRMRRNKSSESSNNRSKGAARGNGNRANEGFSLLNAQKQLLETQEKTRRANGI